MTVSPEQLNTSTNDELSPTVTTRIFFMEDKTGINLLVAPFLHDNAANTALPPSQYILVYQAPFLKALPEHRPGRCQLNTIPTVKKVTPETLSPYR